MLSFCLYVPYRCHSRTFLSLSCLYVPLSLFTGIFFDLYPLYVPSGSFSRFLCRTEMFRKGKSVYLLVSITKKPGNTQLNVLPPPSSFVFRHYPQSVFLLHPYESFPSQSALRSAQSCIPVPPDSSAWYPAHPLYILPHYGRE